MLPVAVCQKVGIGEIICFQISFFYTVDILCNITQQRIMKKRAPNCSSENKSTNIVAKQIRLQISVKLWKQKNELRQYFGGCVKIFDVDI